MKKHYEEKNGNENGDLSSQTQAITSGKIQIPDHFKENKQKRIPRIINSFKIYDYLS